MSGAFHRRVGWPCALALLGLAGCHLFNVTPPPPDRPDKDPGLAAPNKHSFRLSQYVFHYDFDLNRDQPLFQELADLRDQVYKELQLPEGNSLVQVYLFEDKAHYDLFMHSHYPHLPTRRAFFVAQAPSVGGSMDLLVYTYSSDRVKEDLRHELTHALLHSVLVEVPLWLDEGLAEYFEVPPTYLGVNYRHLELIRRNPKGPFQPDLNRLEHLSEVEQMYPPEYREAWAWVHLMLRDKPEAKKVLLGYLQQLRTRNPGPINTRLAAVYPVPNTALETHLAQLDTAPPSVPTAQR